MGLAQKITPPRSGTRLEDRGDFYLKSSEDLPKIDNEFRYFQVLPNELKIFHPEVLRDPTTPVGSYLIRKIPSCDASIVLTCPELYSEKYFSQLLQKIDEFLKACPERIVSRSEFQKHLNSEVFKKDAERLKQIERLNEASDLKRLCQKASFSDLESALDCIHNLLEHHSVLIQKYRLHFSHGDLCLSNILVHNEKIYCIDPRGFAAGQDTFRTEYYDFAKLAQCFEGGYDYINHGLISAPEIKNPPPKKMFQQYCERKGLNRPFLKALEASLFFSMIPLHKDSPAKMSLFLQQALRIANDLRS